MNPQAEERLKPWVGIVRGFRAAQICVLELMEAAPFKLESERFSFKQVP